MIKILLKGASGKMGQRIIACAKADVSFQVVNTIENADVMIDFSHPDATLPNLETAALAKKRAVIGTTGHTAEQKKEIARYAQRLPFILSPNMSVGVNVMWEILGRAARLLESGFDPSIKETHHIHKKDRPSGTALRVAHVIAEGMKTTPDRISIESIREGEAVGTHTTLFSGPGETLEVTHTALSRDTFALGALRAARWVIGKPNGLYSMGDVLGMI